MALLRKPILKPIVGLNYMDPSTMLEDRGGFPRNMRLSRNDLKKREGKTLYGDDAISGSVLHLVQYPLESQVIRLLRMSQRKCEKWNTTTEAWDDITGSDFTGGDSDFFSTTVAENELIITNGVDAMRTYDDAGNTADLVASTGTVPVAKYISYNEAGYLISAYIQSVTAGPVRIQWTDIGDITAHGSGNYGASLLRHSPDPIRGIHSLNEYTVCYKKDAIYLGRPVDTSDIFIWDLVWTGVGLISNRAVVEHNGRHYFMGTDDFYQFNAVRPESIGNDSVQREVFSRLDADKIDRCFAMLMTAYDEVWFFIVTSGEDWPTEVWKYNYRTGYWYMDTCSALTSAALYYAQSSVAWNDLVGTWEHQMWRWDDNLTTTDSPTAMFGDADGYTYKNDPFVSNDNDVAIDGAWTSMDFTADKFETYKRWLQLEFEAKGNNVKVEYSTDFGDTWTTIKTVALSDQWPVKPYVIYFDIVARNIRFRFSNATLNETFFLRTFYPYYLEREDTSR